MDVPFESFAELVFRLGHPPPSKRSAGPDGRRPPLSPSKIFTSWIKHLPRPFPPKTGTRIFRLLFPHEGNRRRYGLREAKFAEHLEGLLAVQGLQRWDAVGWDGVGGLGCLGDFVGNAVLARVPEDTRSSITITEVDTLLDELATASAYSQLSQEIQDPRSTSTILRRLYREAGLSPRALAVLTQIVLRDLRPLLNPLPMMRARHPTLLLRVKTNEGPAQLGLHEAMWCWDPVMARLFRDGKGCMEWCASAAEAVAAAGEKAVVPFTPGPVIGVNVQIPKCIKGRSVKDALKSYLTSQKECRSVWAETKYDGYRMQIHVQVTTTGSKITIFSKSKRKSTWDRKHTHSLIHAALGLPIPQNCPTHPTLRSRHLGNTLSAPSISSVILEAEVVPYNEGGREGGRGPGIEEFWRLAAAGVSAETHSTLPHGSRHLCLAFFDILHLNGESLIDSPYSVRRSALERVVRPIEGFSLLASRVKVPLTSGAEHAEKVLREAFDRCTGLREEGLVLKADESAYIDSQLRWIKLKKDYIPNVGDCVDLVVLGAGWDLDRARELRVDTSVFTTFYIGTLVNREQVTKYRQVPQFEMLFRASYGMTRDQLEVYNESIRLGRWGNKPFDKDDPWKRRLIGLTWKHTPLPSGMKPPSVLFEQPLCAEVMGAGFQRLPFSNLYELRWPRLQKIFDRRERSWVDALDAPALLKVAHESLGYTAAPPPPLSSPEVDSIEALWRSRSTAAIDIPDLSPTPKRTRRLEARRLSAPTVLKLSPASPRNDAPPSSPTSPLVSRRRLPPTGGLGAPFESPAQSSTSTPNRRVAVPTPGRLLFESPRKRRRLPSPPTSSPRALATAGTGTSEPKRRKLPSSPKMPTPAPSSARPGPSDHQPVSAWVPRLPDLPLPPLLAPHPPQPTPPTSSPAAPVMPDEAPLKPLRPLSIRSRLILHARRKRLQEEHEARKAERRRLREGQDLS